MLCYIYDFKECAYVKMETSLKQNDFRLALGFEKKITIY
jgi:hypothetical protein